MKMITKILTVFACILMSSSLIQAKKPVKPTINPSAIATFADNPGDMLFSDGLGSYDSGFEFSASQDRGRFNLKRSRTIFLDYSNCLSETCSIPTDQLATVQSFFFYFDDPSGPMVPGEIRPARFSLYPRIGRDSYMTFTNWDNLGSVEAFDTDDDGNVDRYVVNAPEDIAFHTSFSKGNTVTSVGDFSIPFTFTVDMK
jgi:hypothetical protein